MLGHIYPSITVGAVQRTVARRCVDVCVLLRLPVLGVAGDDTGGRGGVEWPGGCAAPLTGPGGRRGGGGALAPGMA